MSSFILGQLEFDEAALRRDLSTIAAFPRIAEEYDEFSSGFWQNCSLWNASGDCNDTTYRDFEGPARKTEHAASLPYVSSLVVENFNLDYIKMVRTRNLIDGMVIPHRDFVELNKSAEYFFRVFLPLEDNKKAFHSDEGNVFRMRKGEVWFLDASITHAAANFSTESRVSLCLDFIFPGPFQPEDIFSNEAAYDRSIRPVVPERHDPEPDFNDSILNLANIVTRHNFKYLAFMLPTFHFSTRVPIGACYDWLVEIGGKCGDSAIARKSETLRRYMVTSRGLGERFSFAGWQV